MTSDAFCSWENYASLLYADRDPRFPSAVYGIYAPKPGMAPFAIDEPGACFGYVQQGRAIITGENYMWDLHGGQWFVTPSSCVIYPHASAKVLIVQRLRYQGVAMAGGPIEDLGRLRYIDGCSDTLLACPPLLGDPCLNHLHFPPGIDQTAHTHPSLRAGIVARGHGECISLAGTTQLSPGLIFVIPTDARHKFRTKESSMDVIAYHPDSDWGPTHEEHPMVNRTLVGGQKIDNSGGVHAQAQIVLGALAHEGGR